MMGAQLDYLCGTRVMGWQLSNGVEMYSDGQWYTGSDESPDTQRQDHEWNPSTCLDDALLCLERAFWKDGKKQFWFFKYWKGGYSCGPLSSEWAVTAVEPSIAMCLCALRACGVEEDEISKALQLDS